MPASCSGATVYVVLDEIDVERLAGRSLSIGSHGYAQMFDEGRVTLVHRWIVRDVTGSIPSTMRVDHVNRIKLDCSRDNLRLVTPTENNLNREISSRELPVGVYRARSGRYVSTIKRHRVTQYLGTYDTVEEAVAARESASTENEREAVRPMASAMKLETVTKQLGKTQAELDKLDSKAALYQSKLDGLPQLREELEDRIAYLTTIKNRREADAANGIEPTSDVADEFAVDEQSASV